MKEEFFNNLIAALILNKEVGFSFTLNFFVFGLILIIFIIWLVLRKKIKLLTNIIEGQKEFYKKINADNLILEEELIKRTKKLHDMETILEFKVDERVEKLKNELARAKEIAASKDEFIRITSHELRTPMDIVRGNVDMVLKGETGSIPEKTKEYLEDVLSGADRLTKIVNDMLDISRIETGRLKFDFKKLDIADIINHQVKDFEPLAKKNKNIFKTKFENNLPKVFSDKEKIIQILDNLIGNAIKFTANGSIDISAHQENDFIIIEIKDTGIGIAPEEQSKLFQKFPQIDQGKFAGDKGTGLGLYICHELAIRIGGKIWTESNGRDKGSKFSFSLPIASSQRAMEIEKYYRVKEEKL